MAKFQPQDLLLGCGGSAATLNPCSTSIDGQQDCVIFCAEGNNREARTKELPQWGFRNKAPVNDLFIKHLKATPFRPYQEWFPGYMECFRAVLEFEEQYDRAGAISKLTTTLYQELFLAQT